MATTPMSMIDEELRAGEKRRRVDESEAEAEDMGPLPELSTELQLQLVETLEAGQRGVHPSPAEHLVQVSSVFREVYKTWAIDRGARMEHPPSIVALSQARLFISPRFKLISAMRVSVVRQVIEAFVEAMRDEWEDMPGFPLLMLFRRESDRRFDTRGWELNYLGDLHRRGPDLIEFESLLLRDDGGRYELSQGVTTISGGIGDLAPTIHIRLKAGSYVLTVKDALIYGRVFSLIPEQLYPIGDVNTAMMIPRNLFKFDSARFDRPTAGMLAWKNKIVVISVEFSPMAFTGSDFTVRVDLFYGKTSEEEQMVTTHIELGRHQLVAELSDAVIRSASKQLGLGPRAREMITSDYLRMDIVWPNGARLELSDSRRRDDPDHGFTLPEHENALNIIRSSVEAMPEPALAPLVRNVEWGYKMSKHLAELSPDRESTGMMVMPAPWFFYLTDADEHTARIREGVFRLAQGRFVFYADSIMLLALEDDHILAHQPHELIYFDDMLESDSLKKLAMVQRSDILERATAPLAEVELM